MNNSNIYNDPNFWAVIVAFISLILTQLPQVRFWLKPKKIEIRAENLIRISHSIGHPEIALMISIKNTGGKSVEINKISVKMFRDGTEICILPVESYFEKGAETPTLFTPITIKPEERWAHSAMLFKRMDRNTLKTVKENSEILASTIEATRMAYEFEPSIIKRTPIEVQESLIQPFLEIYKKHYIWEPGDYSFEFIVQTDAGTKITSSKYRFVLFEFDKKTISSSIDKYKYGWGILHPSPINTRTDIPIEVK